MTVIEILKSVSLYLELTDELETLFNGSADVSEEAQLEFDKILKAINNMVEKLSFKFFSHKTKEIVLFENGQFNLDLLKEKYFKINALINNNKKINFEVNENIIKADFNGEAVLNYFYVPKKVVNIEDKILVDNRISENIFVLGVVSEYCFINGLFDDGKIWEEKFLNSLSEISGINKSFHLPKRRWF